MENLTIVVQIIGIGFVLGLGLILVWSMTKDGKLSANEASKVIIMVGFTYAMIVNGTRIPDTQPIYDSSIILILLGSVLTMAGIDAYNLMKKSE